jgi:hypothetical protein
VSFENAYFLFTLAVCVAAAVLLPLISRITSQVRQLREEQEAEFLREYPELADLLTQDRRL